LVRSTRRSNVMSPPAWQASSDPARPRRPATRCLAADQLADGVQYSPGLALCPAIRVAHGAAKRGESAAEEWLLIVDRDTGPDAGDHRAGGLAALAGRSRGRCSSTASACGRGHPAVLTGREGSRQRQERFADCDLLGAVSVPQFGEHFANFGFRGGQLFAKRRGPRNVAAAPAFPGPNCRRTC
jgi:hypothetical protein